MIARKAAEINGIDFSMILILDLPTQSTLLYNATKILIRWEQLLVASLDSYHIEENLIDAYHLNDGSVLRGGLTLQKTKLLLDPDNTPFR